MYFYDTNGVHRGEWENADIVTNIKFAIKYVKFSIILNEYSNSI